MGWRNGEREGRPCDDGGASCAFFFCVGDGRWLQNVQQRRRAGETVDRREHHNAAAVARRGIGLAWLVEGAAQ